MRFVPDTDTAVTSNLGGGAIGATARSTRIATAPNFRDFGGQATRNGGRVREGLLYRSEAIIEPAIDDAVGWIQPPLLLPGSI